MGFGVLYVALGKDHAYWSFQSVMKLAGEGAWEKKSGLTEVLNRS